MAGALVALVAYLAGADMRVRVKICGITRVEDGVAAAERGADAVGLVFYPGSSRAVDAASAARIVSALPPFVTVVGLFVNADEGLVRETLERVPIDLLQFHGDEDADYCARFARPYLKSVRVREAQDVAQAAERHGAARALLLDTHRPRRWGGTGETFDWSLVPALPGARLVLAGGLHPGNVAGAVRAVRPYAVDVSSGVEEAPGVKDPGLIEAFIDEVNRVEAG